MRRKAQSMRELSFEHGAERIRKRVSGPRSHSYLRDAVLGGIDGCVTTFAVVAGSVGAQFPGVVIVVLGFANLLADGFSMAASNYLGAKSEREEVERARQEENRHISLVPAGEREEVRQIFANKGFRGETLNRIVDVITRDRNLWVDTMITEEHGLALEGPLPIRGGLATFIAFLLVGLVPLLPFLFSLPPQHRFAASAVATAFAFLAVGILKGRALGRSLIRSGVETFAIGSSAAALAYIVGIVLHRAFGAA